MTDTDPQGNLSHTLKADPKKGTIYEVFSKEQSVPEVLQKTDYGDCLCSSPLLSSADKTLAKVGAEYLLKEALEPVTDNYDFIVVDTPPSLGLLTVNTLTACQRLVIPSQADMYSLQGISQIAQTVETVRKYCNPSLKIAGILITRFNARTVISREIDKMMAETAAILKTKVFQTHIRECVVIKKAEAQQVDIFSYDRKSNAVTDYANFIREFWRDINGE